MAVVLERHGHRRAASAGYNGPHPHAKGQEMADRVNEPIEPIFFATPQEFRAWLLEHHATDRALWVGFHKKGTGRPSITWPEAVDEALCVGWIDGVRKGIDDASYAIRFTPRRRGSTWSAVNVRRVQELSAEGRVQPSGLQAFEERTAEKTAIYSHEQAQAVLDEDAEQQFRANEAAWRFFMAQAASYRKAAIWWIVSAKQVTTRQRRLAALIETSAEERTLPQFSRRAKSS
jgi:uncharacterized protein YdeI (YjbR/CyaY-like superfamily)